VEGLVNILGAVIALLCAVLLYRGYWRTGARLLGWSAACFFGMALESAILFVDLFVYPDVNLTLFRQSMAAAGIVCLIVGLVWESK
jgi:hypothetical protein